MEEDLTAEELIETFRTTVLGNDADAYVRARDELLSALNPSVPAAPTDLTTKLRECYYAALRSPEHGVEDDEFRTLVWGNAEFIISSLEELSRLKAGEGDGGAAGMREAAAKMAEKAGEPLVAVAIRCIPLTDPIAFERSVRAPLPPAPGGRS